jgi:hypothetical protein
MFVYMKGMHYLKFILCLQLVLWSCQVKSQVAQPCPSPPPPGAPNCQAACVYCNFDGTMGINNGFPSGGAPVCAGQITLHNDQWFGFIAGSTSITINIATSNCVTGDGLQVALFENCTDDAVACNAGVPNGAGQPLMVSYSNFIPGQTYFLMIDGYIADVCNYTIEVLDGSVSAPPAGAPMQPQGPLKVCPGATAVYHIDPVPNAGYYTWTGPSGSHINGGSNNVSIAAPDGTTVTVTFGNSGGQLCVKAGNACTPATQACINIIDQPIPATIKPEKVVCFEDLPYTWDESPNTTIAAAGTYLLTSTPYASYLGCDSTVKQSIRIMNQIKTNLNTIFICEGTCFSINGNSYCTTGGPFQEKFQSYRGCDSVVQFSIYQVPSHAHIPPVASLDCNNPQVTLNSTGSTTGPTVTYNWTNSTWTSLGNGTTQTVNSGGIYHLIVADPGGTGVCYDTATIQVIANLTPPGATATGGNFNCIANSVTLLGNSTSGGVTYQWTGPGISPANQNLQNPTVLVQGTYSLTVTNPSNSCTSTATSDVNADTTPPTATASGGTLNCTQPVLTIHGGTSASSASWNWTGPGINSGNQTLSDPPVILPGSYAVTVTSLINGCTNVATTAVDQDISAPTASAGPDQTINCFSPSVTLSGSGNTGSAPANYQWSGPGINPGNQSLSSPSVNQAGTYVMHISNAINGCGNVDTVLVLSDILAPKSEAGPDKILTCKDTLITLDGQNNNSGGGFSLLWSGPGISSINSQQLNPSIGSSGTYFLTFTNTINGCTATDSVQVTVNTAHPTASAGPDLILTCSSVNGVSLSGSGMPTTVDLLWSGPGIGINNDTLPMPVVTQPGTYVLQVTDPVNGCTATHQVLVTKDPAVPNANAGPDLVLNCSIATVDFNPTGTSAGPTFTYHWSGPGISGVDSTILAPSNINLPGTYNLVVTNTLNGCKNSDVIVVLIDTIKPVISAGPDLVLNCFNNSIDTLNGSLSGSGPNFEFMWTGPGISTGNQHDIRPVINQPGTYDLVVTNTISTCSATSQSVVSIDIAAPVADAGADKTIDCVLTSVSIGANSSSGINFDYLWSGPGITALNQSQKTPVVSIAGTYALVVTNKVNGCTQGSSMTVFTSAVFPVASAGGDVTLTCSNPAVTLNGAGSSTGANFQASWSGPGITPANQHQFTPLVSQGGAYMLTITNTQNNCASTDTVIAMVNQNLPGISVPGTLNLDCQKTSVILDGSMSLTGPGITYQWSGPGITPAMTGMVSPAVSIPGTYTMVVTDQGNGCTASKQTIVIQDITPPIALAGNDVTLTCAQPNLSLNGSGSSSGLNFNYVWTGPDINTNNFSLLQPIVTVPGLYTLIVTNTANHCTASDFVMALQDIALPITSAGPDQTLTCAMDTLQLDGALSQVGPNIQYFWTGPGILPGEANSSTPHIDSAGIYTLVVKNLTNGCTNTDAVQISEDKLPPFAGAGLDQTINCTNALSGVVLDGSSSNSGTGYVLNWAGPGITPANKNAISPVVISSGSYLLTVTKTSNGCTASDSVLVLKDMTAPVANAGSDASITCLSPVAALDGSQSAASGSPVSYTWTGPGIDPNNQNDAKPGVNLPGTYVLTVTNLANGCTSIDQAQVSLDNLPPVLTSITDTITCAHKNGKLGVVSSVPGSQFSWAGPGINAGNVNSGVFQVTAPGAYAVTVTAPNGCTALADIVMNASIDFPSGGAEGATLDCKNNGTAKISGMVLTPGATFEWLNPAGQHFSSIADPIVTQPGIYSFVITAGNGCQQSIQVVVQSDFNKPAVQAQASNLIDCHNNSVVLSSNGSASGPIYLFHWSTVDGNIISGVDGLTATANKPGGYQLIVTNSLNGCKDSTLVKVLNDPSVPTSIRFDVHNILCYGDDSGSIMLQSVKGGTQPLLFSLNMGPFIHQSDYTGLPAGSYIMDMEDAKGCHLDTILEITQPGPLTLELGADKHIHLGESVTIQANVHFTTPIEKVIWNVAPNCDSTGVDCFEFTYMPLQTTRHQLTLIDSNGCKVTDAVTVFVDKKRLFYVPNVFMPSSDEPINALFMIQGGASIKNIRRLIVFDRWGNSVFESNNFLPNLPANAWDGTFRGEKAPTSVYAWMTEIEFIDGTSEIFTGDVTLVR